MEPTLTQVFGANAVQDATTLTISKSDLIELTASSSNTAESLFVAMLLKAKAHLSATNLDLNADQSISIENSFDSIVTRLNNTYRQSSLTVNLQKLDTSTGIDPDDY